MGCGDRRATDAIRHASRTGKDSSPSATSAISQTIRRRIIARSDAELGHHAIRGPAVAAMRSRAKGRSAAR